MPNWPEHIWRLAHSDIGKLAVVLCSLGCARIPAHIAGIREVIPCSMEFVWNPDHMEGILAEMPCSLEHIRCPG